MGIRTRLTVLYASLFLVAGAALLALTYGLLASRLPVTAAHAKLPRGVSLAELVLCKQPPIEPAMLATCKEAFQLGAKAASESQRSRALSTLLTSSLIGLGVVTILSAWLGWWLSGRALRPVRRITEAARHASQLNLTERIALSGPKDELHELADTFDDMLAKLDLTFQSQRRFVANAAHELRTPLTVIRTAIEVTLSKSERSPEQLEAMAAKIGRSVTHAEATVEALLALASGQQPVQRQDVVDIATAAEDAIDACGSMLTERRLEIETELEPARVRGDRVLLERMVANLVDNAARHNHLGGFIRLRTWEHEGAAELEIANSGPFVPPDSIPALTEPFGRANERLQDTDGIGLGLSIASAIALSHGGGWQVVSRPSGGLTVTIAFSAAADDADSSPSPGAPPQASSPSSA